MDPLVLQTEVTLKICKYYTENCKCPGCEYTKLQDINRELQGKLAIAMQEQMEKAYIENLIARDYILFDVDPFFKEAG